MFNTRTIRTASLRLLILTGAQLMIAGMSVVSQTIYAAVWGHPKFVVGSSTLNSGLYRSTDMGRTWTHLGPQNLKAFSMASVDSARGRVLYIAAGNGVHRSIDSGRTWKIVTDWRMTEVLDVAVDQLDPRRVFAATAYGLWQSVDGGDTWSNPAGTLQNVFVRELTSTNGLGAVGELSPLPTNAYDVWSSVDNGFSWGAVATKPAQPTRLFDGIPSHGARHSVGDNRFVATWGNGVFRFDGSAWTQSGLEGSQVWSLVVTNY